MQILPLLQGLWRFCVEQPTSPGYLSRREENGGRGCENGVHTFPRRTQLLWHSTWTFPPTQCTGCKRMEPNNWSRLMIKMSLLFFNRLPQVELRAYWWPARHTEIWRTNVASNTLKCKWRFRRVTSIFLQVVHKFNHFLWIIKIPPWSRPNTCFWMFILAD